MTSTSFRPGDRVTCTEFGLTLTGTVRDIRDLGVRLDIAIEADHDGQRYHRPAHTLTPLQEEQSMTATDTPPAPTFETGQYVRVTDGRDPRLARITGVGRSGIDVRDASDRPYYDLQPNDLELVGTERYGLRQGDRREILTGPFAGRIARVMWLPFDDSTDLLVDVLVRGSENPEVFRTPLPLADLGIAVPAKMTEPDPVPSAEFATGDRVQTWHTNALDGSSVGTIKRIDDEKRAKGQRYLQVKLDEGKSVWRLPEELTPLPQEETPESPADDDSAPQPDLTSVPHTVPGTLGILEVPLSQVTRSTCNVRRHYDPAALEELAASLASQGQLENATGRWTPEGQIEIVAGESRRRAQLLRAERGEITLDHPFLVRVRDLTDAEALEISATENMRRRSMTPLEECEAMSRMQDAGRTPEEIAAVFGYKSVQPVVDRVLAARNLHTTPRELLDRGELSLACAVVIARAPGEALQLNLTQHATSTYNRMSARHLAQMLTHGQFEVRHAAFNVEKSGLDVTRDLFDTFEPYFTDKAAALAAQVAHAEKLAERRRKTGKWEFVDVVTDAEFSVYSSKGKYDGYHHGAGGLVIRVQPSTGMLEELQHVRLRVTRAAVTESGTTESVPTERPITARAYTAGHEARALAVRERLLFDHHRTLVLTIMGVLGCGRVAYTGVTEYQHVELGDTYRERARQLDARTGGLLLASPTSSAPFVTSHSRHASGKTDEHHAALYDALMALEQTELLDVLSLLTVHKTAGWNVYGPQDPAYGFTEHLARDTGAVVRFRLTDDWLKGLPRSELLALAADAGLDVAPLDACDTQKEIRARLLEHADRLYTEGFVPKLARFASAESA